MKYNDEVYKDVFSCFPAFMTGLKVGDIIQPQRISAKFKLMPDQIEEVLSSMEEEGILMKDDGQNKNKLGGIRQAAWHLTERGYELYFKLCR